MRKYNAIRNAVNFGKGKKKMRLITPKRSTKQLEKGFLYEVVSEVDSFGYFKVREPVNPGYGFNGSVHHIHKSNMKEMPIK